MSLRYLTAQLAKQIDEELMSTAGAFSLDQLMELAGLACAQILAKVYPKKHYPRVLVCCGPGNQGGDGLVATRHLKQFGYNPTLFMPKPGNKDIYKRLQKQCTNMSIPTISNENSSENITALKDALKSTDVILDAIFGFSFSPPLRAPFDAILPVLADSGLPIVSVDIPSGWDVEDGRVPIIIEDADGKEATFLGLTPEVLISLTAPKLGVKDFKEKHFLGGRFINKELEQKFELNLPEYPGYEQIVELPPISGGQKL